MKNRSITPPLALVILLLSGVSLTTAIAQVSTCRIEGKVLDSDNKPVPFAAIILETARTRQARGTSASSSGDFRFETVEPGKYTLTVRRVGFEAQSRDVEVMIGQTTSVSFTLAVREADTEMPELQRPAVTPQPGLDARVLQWYAFDEGMAQAQQTNKKLFVHVYTDWCGWCKKMDREVYTNPEVKSALRSNFVPVKLNAESPRELSVNGRRLSEMDIARGMGVTGYPTVVFLYPSGEPLTKVSGYMETENLLKMLRYVTENQ